MSNDPTLSKILAVGHVLRNLNSTFDIDSIYAQEAAGLEDRSNPSQLAYMNSVFVDVVE